MDWGVLRALPANVGLPGRFTALLPDRVLVEILGSAKPEAFFAKLSNMLLHPDSHGRVVVGRYWHDIAAAEKTPKDVWPGTAASAQVELSTQFLGHQRHGVRFADYAALPTYADLQDRKAEFVDMTRRYAVWLRETHPDTFGQLARGGHAEVVRVIQEGGASMAELVASTDRKYGTPAWRIVLSHFPDRCAAGRWLRLAAYYAMMRAITPDAHDEVFGNNYDDAHYGLLSLYTRHIWTRDRGLRHAVTAVSAGSVHVHSELASIPTYG